ncbi:MAG: dTDP-4-dehydrorhamnose reductase [Firmicutes bacterium]|nr:dTDP-4-dehydrorhamnose reductase [Bacillota bacterium]
MRILVTGARGMLGTDLVDTLSKEHEVVGIDIDDLDITDAGQTKKKILEVSPELVVHAAAYTDVDGCESNLELAYKVNAIGTQNIALACQISNSAMLYFSTDFVFGGEKSTPYLEWDRPNPLSVYGASKYAGEHFVSHLLERYYIVRIAWLYGEHGKNFVKTILRLADEKDKLQVVDDQVGSPTYTIDVARAVLTLIKRGNYGIYHMVNKGEVSWYGFAKKILEISGRHDVLVEPIATEVLNRPAKRPAYSVLKNLALELTIGDPMRDWEEALEEFIEQKVLKRSRI